MGLTGGLGEFFINRHSSGHGRCRSNRTRCFLREPAGHDHAILAFDGSGDQRVRAGAELDVGIVSFFRLQDGGIAVGGVRIGQHLHGSAGQDELASGKAHGGSGHDTSVGGDQRPTLVGREQHAVEHRCGNGRIPMKEDFSYSARRRFELGVSCVMG